MDRIILFGYGVSICIIVHCELVILCFKISNIIFKILHRFRHHYALDFIKYNFYIHKCMYAIYNPSLILLI